MRAILAAAAALLLTTPAAFADPTAPAAKPADGVAIPTPPDGKGEIVFYRRSSLVGAAVWFNVRENNNLLGKLSNGAYFVVVADPGTHAYTGATENKDTVRLQVDPGETYFVEGRLTMGVVMAEANLAPTDQPSFDKVSKHLHLVKSSAPPPGMPDPK